LDGSLVFNNPRYREDEIHHQILIRNNPLEEKKLNRRQTAIQIYRNQTPPELSLRRMLHGFTPQKLGNLKAVEHYFQSRCIHYEVVKEVGRSKAFFVLDGHRIPSSRIRDDADKPVWTPTALRQSFPHLPGEFTLGYPLSKMRGRRKRKSKNQDRNEWQAIADDLTRAGRAEVNVASRLFAALHANHFVIHAELPSPEFRFRPNPMDRSKPSGFVDRFPVSSPTDLGKLALRLRVAEDQGARIKFLPMRHNVVYVAILDLSLDQLREVRREYSPSLVIEDLSGNYSVYLAAGVCFDPDTCMAGLRLFASNLHDRFHIAGLPPPPVFPLGLPGFRPILGQQFPGDPAIADVRLVEASHRICPVASKQLATTARRYQEHILPQRGTLFSVGLRRLGEITAEHEVDTQFLAVSKAHLADLQSKAIPPTEWEEVDRCLALRLRVVGFNHRSVTEIIAKTVPRIRTAAEGIPEDCNAYARGIADWAMNASKATLLLQDMADHWKKLEKPVVEALMAREATQGNLAASVEEKGAIKLPIASSPERTLAGPVRRHDPLENTEAAMQLEEAPEKEPDSEQQTISR